MQIRYWWRGLLWSFLPFLLLALYVVFCFSFSSNQTFNISYPLVCAPAIGAFLGGFRTAYGQRSEGLLAGLSVCAGLWLICCLAMALFLPELFGTWLFLLLAIMLPGGIFGGIAGMSTARMFRNRKE